MIKSEYQEWNDGNLVHEYIKFDRDKAIANGQEKAVARYDYCLKQFMKETEEQRKNGLVYGGIEFDFWLKECNNE